MMNFVSTRNAAPAVNLSQAIAAGLAPDGGLYVPQALPAPRQLRPGASLAETTTALLAPFFAGDALEPELAAICAEALDFPVPLVPLATPGDHVLELFHGPTAAFKDVGARFLAACLARIRRGADRPLTILVATSGDTGAAVAAAFHGQPGLRVVVLYPDGRVSPRQAHQLGCFGGNVSALRVAGSFDDCQALVKRALNDAELQAQVPLSSANSISLGRLLPQMSYYAHASLSHHAATGRELNFVVPTGNLGNALAGILARALGAPLGRIVLATNANRVLPEFFAGDAYSPRPSVATLANAMDVGAPSNFERLLWLYGGDEVALREGFTAISVGDDTIRATIQARSQKHGEVFCPHTATAVHVLQELRADGTDGDWAVAATAHPAKFESVVEPLVGHPVEVPPALAELLARPAQAEPVPPEYEALRAHLLR
ncbi:threonine synthase [Pseudoxanthomonas sp. SGNA-20]|uniref:threonine synthase n=1 Tax=Pseudoxanthomonas sp. SGNA-20 TaxID=2493088 RepID=UPI0018F43B10|nr:threonine synthase [Pseudoxanthomonas sp. SGNA-20]